MNIVEDGIARAIANNRFFMDKPHQDIEYFIYGDKKTKTISLLNLVRIAYQAGIHYGDPEWDDKLDIE